MTTAIINTARRGPRAVLMLTRLGLLRTLVTTLGGLIILTTLLFFWFRR